MLSFPNPTFAWIALLLLIGFAGIAAYIDLTKAIIPNKLNVTILAVGVLMNLVRGGWLGAEQKKVWLFNPAGVAVGMGDGLLFSLAGFALAFVVLTGLWMLTQTGAGDVKLFAALGSWIGPWGFVLVWIVSLPLLLIWMVLRISFGASSIKQEKKDMKHISPKRGRTRTTYSLPIAVSVALCGFWLCRSDLQLSIRQPATPAPQGAQTTDGPASTDQRN